jgi:molybdopterin-containing oxidoreductase family iron-sulfur binding subunit
MAARGRSLVIAGESMPPVVHALAHAIKAELGNVGETLQYLEPVEAEPVDQSQSLAELVDAMRSDQVGMLLILGGNPVYNAPGALRFAEAMAHVLHRVHLSDYYDETSFLCHWHIPACHYLESWGDARAYDGTATIQQPLIEPLYAGRTAHELLSVLQGKPGRSAHEIVREYWQGRLGEDGFVQAWRFALHEGIVPDTAAAEIEVELQYDPDAAAVGQESDSNAGIELLLRPDPTVHDGCFATNAWLQELPKPFTKLTWDNALLVSPATAQKLGLTQQTVAKVATGQNAVMVPVWILPGHADDCATLAAGYGRKLPQQTLANIGVNVYPLRSTGHGWRIPGVEIRSTGERYPLASTQQHHNMEHRDLVRATTLERYQADPHHLAHSHHVPEPASLIPEFKYDGNAWGMSIDLTACIGCNACVIACQAENNIPVVGKEQVANGREMHWLRIDQYFEGSLDDPQMYFQPLLCMHCEKAPCEVVCPVAATVHSAEGLNDMIYNRCVGTRYCSNNCPYKVRRFNYLQYVDEEITSLKLMRNPDVTVRSRGVMEKCTYCVQRINAARIEAKKEDRPIRDGEVVTACQAACPTRAIVFGNINDPDSQVRRLKEHPLNYGLLDDLNTQPRTTYLARVSNPNPELTDAPQMGPSHQQP